MSGKLISYTELISLVNKSSVTEIVEYLKNHIEYSSVFRGIQSGINLHRSDLERLLNRALLDNFAKIIKFLNVYHDKFFKIYIKRYEIGYLKHVIRLLTNKHKEATEMYVPEYFRQHMLVHKKNIVLAHTFEELVDILRDTEYFKVLNPMVGAQNSLYSIEMKLDDYYYECLWNFIENYLSGKDREVALKIYGTKIDLTNIEWIVRWKSFYDTPKEIIYSYTINKRYKLKKDDIIGLVESNNSQECMELIEKSKYKGILRKDEMVFMEHNRNQYMMNLQKKIAGTKTDTIAPIIFYLFKKETEIENLTKIIECVRYKADVSQLENYIVK